MRCDALITVKLTLGYGKCQFPLATWRLSPDFPPQICAVSRGAAPGHSPAWGAPTGLQTCLPASPHTLGQHHFFFFFSIFSSSEIASQQKPKDILQASGPHVAVIFFLRPSLGGRFWIFHLAGTDFETFLSTTIPAWNQLSNAMLFPIFHVFSIYKWFFL